MELHRTKFTIPITQLEEWLDLPEGTNISNVSFERFNLTIQFLSNKEIDQGIQVDHISNVGRIFKSA